MVLHKLVNKVIVRYVIHTNDSSVPTVEIIKHGVNHHKEAIKLRVHNCDIMAEIYDSTAFYFRS